MVPIEFFCLYQAFLIIYTSMVVRVIMPRRHSVKKYLLWLVIYFFLLTFSKNTMNIFLALIMVIWISLLITIFFKNYRDEYYQLRFTEEGKKYHLKAFFDTGLKMTYRNYPVIVVNDYYQFKRKADGYMVAGTISNPKVLKLYFVKDLKIGLESRQGYLTFAPILYQALINRNLFL